MTNFVKKISVGAVSAAIAIASYAPAVFAGDMEISSNGNNSTNTITVTNVSTCDVTQKTGTSVGAVLSATSSTGGNTASGNTGAGDVTIDTGNASSTVTMSVAGGSNTANNPCCDCQLVPPSGDRKIVDNGKDSSNGIVETNVSAKSVTQKSKTRVEALLSAKARTGRNRANNNTGSGLVEVLTGTSTTNATLSVAGGGNSLP